MGLRVSVYKHGKYDCTLNGVSSRHDTLTLVGRHPVTGEEIRGPFDPSDEAPAVKLQVKMIGGEAYVSAVPVTPPDGKSWAMFGGNFIYTSDGRFPEKYPIPLHDRYE